MSLDVSRHRQERAVVHQFVEPFGLRCLQEFANAVTPDLDSIFERSRLSYARQDDDRATCLTEHKVVLRKKHHLFVANSQLAVTRSRLQGAEVRAGDVSRSLRT